jgi:hypothetical protein
MCSMASSLVLLDVIQAVRLATSSDAEIRALASGGAWPCSRSASSSLN